MLLPIPLEIVFGNTPAPIPEKDGVKEPKEYVDKLVKEFQDAWKALNIDFSGFIRTTDKHHEENVKN